MKGNLRPAALLLALLICASAASCGNSADGTADKATETQTTTITADTETSAETDKHDLLLYIAARSVLDKCADVDEAVAFISEYDMYSPSRFSYHLFLTDKSSKEGTRRSAIYDLDDFEVEACFNADYENKYEFKGTE